MKRKKLLISELKVKSFKTQLVKATRGGKPKILSDELEGECTYPNYTCEGCA
ncbi:hypothetical protein AB9P05_00330 [Roseivirga sp. BDSF3-8]|uniref:hypothetical protein n=1 Tax=Roseivirga sp. BDSF3-8 TaxID=3241598 RepID=UPI0035319638